MVYNDYSVQAGTVIRQGMTRLRALLTTGKTYASTSVDAGEAHNLAKEALPVCKKDSISVRRRIQRTRQMTSLGQC